MRLYVTRKDLDEGIACTSALCPVGRSANRAAVKRGWDLAQVGATSMCFLVGKGVRTRTCTRRFSAKTRRFIKHFDRGRLNRSAFKPFYLIVQDIPDLTAGNPG